MNDITYKKLNATETITQALPRLIEAFTTFYGESERERITEKFNNMLIIGYMKPKIISQLLNEDKKQKSNELIEKFLNNLNIPKEEHQKFKKIFFDNSDIEYPNIHPIYKYVQYKNGNKSDYYKQETYKFLKQLYPDITIDNLDKFIKSKKNTKLNEILEQYKNILTEYSEYQLSLKQYEKYIEQCNNLEKELSKKYTNELINEFKYLFTEEELKHLKENNDKGFSIKYINKKTENYFGYSLNSTALIDSFSIENDELLTTSTKWKKESIIKDRIQFFKNQGIDLGDNYENYIEREDIQKLLPSLQDLAEKMISKRNELYTKMMNAYYTSLDEYKLNIERIEQEGLLDKEHGYNAGAYERSDTFISTNIKRSESGIIMYPMLCLSMGGLSEYLDHHIIHELNHVYELTLQNIEGNKYYGICGWDETEDEYENETPDLVSLDERKIKREYELFNEIVNELISQEITEILFSTDGYIFNTKENAKIKNGSSYENSLFLVKHFYNTYKKEIIESRRTGDMTKLFNIVGKENFESLNQLFHEFYESFPGMAFYSVMRSVNKKEETEQTKKFYDIVRKRDEIITAMETYNIQKTQSLS